jgi:hypothetical protein
MPPSKLIRALGGDTSTASAFNTFKVAKPKAKTRERAKFDLTKRREVKEVRNIRACLRCSLLRIRVSSQLVQLQTDTTDFSECSPGDLCTRCKDLVFHAHEKLTLSFSGCIRTRLIEVSVFEDGEPHYKIHSRRMNS